MRYLAFLHNAPDRDFGVTFPDFPGCITAGKSAEEAKAMAPEALRLHIDGMMKSGQMLPFEDGTQPHLIAVWTAGKKGYGDLVGFFHVTL